jgi:isoquinoline 1-oxidoreductase subunit beta
LQIEEFSLAWYAKTTQQLVRAAVDCGHPLMPRHIQIQIEGSAIIGLSAALGEKLTYKGGQAQQKNLGADT